MDNIPVSNNTKGQPESLKNKILETGASATQDFGPPKRLCAHLNAFHAYANEPGRCVESNHYCAHLNDGMLAETPSHACALSDLIQRSANAFSTTHLNQMPVSSASST